MLIYPHERRTERDQVHDNTIWPKMSTEGIDIDDCKRYLADRGLSWDMAEVNGWYPSRLALDRFLRIVIPALSTKENHVYWQARAVSSNVHIRYQTPKGPRHGALIYVNAEPDILTRDIRDWVTDKVIVVEGPMDALACAECGVDAIALMGMSPGEQALEHLVKLIAKRPALVVLDNEPAAKSAAYPIVMRLASAGGIARVETFRNAKDIASVDFDRRKRWVTARLEEL